MRSLQDIKFSILELVPVRDDKSVQFSLHHALELAQHAEKLGYERLWLAEHHNMDGIASSATAVLLGYLLANTSTLKVGSGGIMLPNHAPLVVAEQFGTLQTLYPNRIELGLGRAPGTDQVTMRALRRGRQETEDQFPQDVLEILSYFKEAQPNQRIVATPGQNTNVPVWLLGSSLFSAQLAARLGLPYSFASHFAPRMLGQAIQLYRDNFQPSEYLDKPYVSMGIPTVVAQTDEEANYLATSAYQRVLGLLRGQSLKLKAPVESMNGLWSVSEKMSVDNFYAMAQIGSIETVKAGLEKILAQYNVDEFIFTCDIYDTDKRLENFEHLIHLKNQ
ncbi:LLM class flavin-dependent oxidoreductase [Acinetobacter portensis]|uniref:LLM class flavin-dependent oxidoreductase n=1 Tax=Acinetobacter portensis TaxID=1839785 RepID=A0ABY4JXX5_9GAMM|nr:MULTISPECIES: LLM class flavin-dependent oxidoreductase [Acinetobacter]MCK7609721.1 LLM class flavin-dependent oxidoreductase [Acinetobacter portensis]MCK7640469.1 LLM class flavin-dependent oxidoreductase [Acinetobacter portensis]MDY6451099.1 LLM class flavin-dependent oxidoreductase [Acinetobacter faecalis]MDY6455933.1 LLM class flavin-dependent oxidoreductase [Acinetobacter faecalis]MDY6467610.1 LLM class flavin-dependent oxidoreductase [Acinetobacter faecalis]